MSEPIRTLLVDDEQPARERMRQLLSRFADVEVIGEAADGEAAVEEILRHKPDLVFLDIQMPGATGLEVAASLPSPRPHIVFCTAYDEYAVDAFELQAVDYLLKPVNRARLQKALDRVRAGSDPEEAIAKAGRAAGAYPERFLAKRGTRFCVVPRRQVIYFLSEDGITRLQADQRHYWMQPTIAELEERLDPKRREGAEQVTVSPLAHPAMAVGDAQRRLVCLIAHRTAHAPASDRHGFLAHDRLSFVCLVRELV